jgi:aldehyde:ferredoxin oxidoreductase
MKGTFQKALVINLFEKKCHDEPITEQVYQHYLGGKGLGIYLLLKKNEPKVDPLSPFNHFIIGLGPINDTEIWGSSRYGIFTKSPLTGIFSESYSGGRVAEPMSRTGYDAIILKGICSSPTFLEVSDEGVQFHDASDVWGADTYETQDTLSEKIAVKDQGMIVIGPAGENLVRYAGVVNNYWRCAGRTGVGAVLGSKKIKGIAFYGSKLREVANHHAVLRIRNEWTQKGKDHPAASLYKNFGTPGLVSIVNTAGAFPTRYWHEGVKDGWENISAETLHSKLSVTPHACSRCFLACGRMTTVEEGKHKGLKIEGPEYETIYAFGGICLIDRLDEIIYLNDICDRLGIDTITGGNMAGFAIEASQLGRIPEKLEYGNAEAVALILHKVARRQGIGNVLAEGVRYAAREWDMEDVAIHVKGMEPAGYDPRVLKGMGLAYATSDRGACHLRATVFKAELSGMIPPGQIEGKAEIFIDFEDRLTLMDALIGCRFYRDLYLWDELAEIVEATTGMKTDKARLQKIASNIRNATRLFNIREGITREDDTLPRRFFEEAIGTNKHVITRDELERLKNDYYALRGWDDSGVPVNEVPLDF